MSTLILGEAAASAVGDPGPEDALHLAASAGDVEAVRAGVSD